MKTNNKKIRGKTPNPKATEIPTNYFNCLMNSLNFEVS
ncbi:hypothetical protein SAMN03097699_0571 [Flavobacteriaceae bacterium MAR_2010_188]|nr:hypothetical protein SAMN03097699_0571 [Flavobacteriaceae bacterium MAR_2010_188]